MISSDVLSENLKHLKRMEENILRKIHIINSCSQIEQTSGLGASSCVRNGLVVTLLP
jgi:hypothetical protein